MLMGTTSLHKELDAFHATNGKFTLSIPFCCQQPNLKYHFNFPELLLPINVEQTWKFKLF